MYVCGLFVCFGSVTAFVPRGQLPREDLRRAPLPPRPLVTPGTRCSSCSLSPHTYCHASCIRSVPSPVCRPPVLYRYPTKCIQAKTPDMRKRPNRKRPIFLTFHNSVFLLLFFLLSLLFLSRSLFLSYLHS